VIGEDGAQLGVMSPQEALRIAREHGLDLVEVAPNIDPPVCRIMDFNKFKYDQARREREAKKKHHVARLKEVKFKPRIGTHDYQVKLLQLKRFLTRGDKAKVTMVFRGREMAHLELGRRVLDQLVVDLKSVGKVERDPVLEGRFMTMIFSPDHAALKRAKKQQTQTSRQTTQSAGAPSEPPPAA
jgi:translation initiation factor IF-3